MEKEAGPVATNSRHERRRDSADDLCDHGDEPAASSTAKHKQSKEPDKEHFA